MTVYGGLVSAMLYYHEKTLPHFVGLWYFSCEKDASAYMLLKNPYPADIGLNPQRCKQMGTLCAMGH
jgi:hypothetical protein